MPDQPTADADAEGTGTEPGPEPEPEPDASVFGEHADYVRGLRAESAERRRRLREAEESLSAQQDALRRSQARLVELEVAEACRGIMADPSDLLAHVEPPDILDGEGAPDPEKIAAAARSLVERKPHLAARRPAPAGDVDQGARPPGPEQFDFAGMLRRAAG